MKSILVIAFLLVILSSVLKAQDSTTTRFERIAWVTGASLAFSFADYLAYNKIRDNMKWSLNAHTFVLYRSVESIVQAALSYVLYKKLGLSSTIAFNLMWWSWFDDLLFYGWSYAFDPIMRWPNRPDPNDNFRGPKLVHGGDIRWAGWTPVGLLRPPRDIIAGNTLIAQSMVGVAISIAILW